MSQTQRLSLWIIASIFLAMVLYSRTLTAYFISDDFALIGRLATDGFYSSWGGFLRPVVVLSWFVDFKIWGLDPLGFHITNVLIHVLNALLVGAFAAALIRQFYGEVDREHVVIASAVFLALSCHSETVTWISARCDLLATTFMLSALIAHVSFIETKRGYFVVASMSLFALALLSKESAVVFPAMIALLTFALTRNLKSAFKSVIPFAVVLAGYAILRYFAIGQFVGGYGADAHLGVSVTQMMWNVMASSVRVLLPPLPSEFVHLLSRSSQMSALRWLAVLVAGGVLIAIAIGLLRNRSRWAPGWELIPALVLCFWASIPLLGYQVVQLGDLRGERFLYLGSAFIAIAAVFFVAWVSGNRWPLRIIMGAWFLASSFSLWHVNGTWASAGSLAQTIAADTAALARGKPIVVANVPNDYRGAWVFRNGLREAASTFQEPAKSVGKLTVLSVHSIRSTSDVAIVKKSDNAWSLELPNYPAPEIFDSPAASVIRRSAHGFEFEAADPDADILYYSAGRMHRVDEPGTVTGPGLEVQE